MSRTWRSYCLVCLNLVSVPWSRSRTPKTPKHWLNLEKVAACKYSCINYVQRTTFGRVDRWTLLEVVEVVELRGGQEGEVVSTMGDGGADQSQAVPQGGGRKVGAQDNWPGHHRQRVGELRARRTGLMMKL